MEWAEVITGPGPTRPGHRDMRAGISTVHDPTQPAGPGGIALGDLLISRGSSRVEQGGCSRKLHRFSYLVFCRFGSDTYMLAPSGRTLLFSCLEGWGVT